MPPETGPKRCIRFWDSLWRQLDMRGLALEYDGEAGMGWLAFEYRDEVPEPERDADLHFWGMWGRSMPRR
jgi:hypothetical protein